ncbi:hypothetical protein KGF56_003610 [Candida oxycetoniae]|uniref:Vacuolar protein-sorting-associated protein 25 n=1 Tax=Candida oxycetoniae TaxID=497107 RepID=A0AAI9WXA9_9ASCO|nr:uncharacterized protein KGF56_003610 [Candida oxycetoniae]KAI3403565.2 hypothetical protein KGF56_003610 [Candida oxycetoniae]
MSESRSISRPQFEFPKIHSFPPFYTKQPNQTIQQQQLESWANIILQYCEFYKITSLTSEGLPKHSQTSKTSLPSLFQNKSINRHVNADFRSTILAHLIHTKQAEYINHKKPELGMFIYWRSIVDWGNILYDYISNTGQKGTVFTLYELTRQGRGENNNDDDDDDAAAAYLDTDNESLLPEELQNMDELLLIKVIQEHLMKQGKAQILMNEHNQIGGVKIV